VFDLDDTLLDHGALREDAYSALFRLKEANLVLVACTGRPAGWGELLVRQWPIDALVAENGGVGLVREVSGEHVRAEVAIGANEREGRAALKAIADEILRSVPEVALADDNDARWTDVTLDVGEYRRASQHAIRTVCALAEARGAHTIASSVHVHLAWTAVD